MTKEAKIICDVCGETIKTRDLDCIEKRAETPHIEVTVRCEALPIVINEELFYKKVMHFHDDCFDHGVIEELMNE